MKKYTYSEARQNLARLLREARAEGEVIIRRRGGEEFSLRPARPSTSPLDVEGVDIGLSAEEIVDMVRESRESDIPV